MRWHFLFESLAYIIAFRIYVYQRNKAGDEPSAAGAWPARSRGAIVAWERRRAGAAGQVASAHVRLKSRHAPPISMGKMGLPPGQKLAAGARRDEIVRISQPESIAFAARRSRTTDARPIRRIANHSPQTGAGARRR